MIAEGWFEGKLTNHWEIGQFHSTNLSDPAPIAGAGYKNDGKKRCGPAGARERELEYGGTDSLEWAKNLIRNLI